MTKKLLFDTLFEKYYKFLCNFTKNITEDFTVSEDIVQEAFLEFWKNIDNFESEETIKSFLFTTCKNKAIDYLRQNKTRHNYQNQILLTVAEASNESNSIIALELEKKIKDTLKNLPEETKKIFLLNREKGLKYAEIAQKLDISVKTVEAHMSKTLKALRESLKEYL